jgi:P-type Ca2+ transporter type 2C
MDYNIILMSSLQTQNNLPYHSFEIDQVLIETNSNLQGLSESQVDSKQKQFGLNKLSPKKSKPLWLKFLSQFNSPLVIILLVVIIISFLLGKISDSVVIFAVVLINAVVGFWQEMKAEASMNSLKSLIVPTARVLRDNNVLQIDSKDLVIGDILILEEGDRIPADCRLYEVKNFSTAEASLTGESYTIPKNLLVLQSNADLADRKNMAWSGTFVAGGSAKGIVVNTGDFTFVGQIAKNIQTTDQSSEFTLKIIKFGKQIALLALFFAAINFGLATYFGGTFSDNLLFAIGSLVSGIPEGLPAILTLVLAIGANKMASQNAIVRQLDATETVGSINVIATDKTGTLTQNTMTINQFVTNAQDVRVTGEGWSFDGGFESLTQPLPRVEGQNEIDLRNESTTQKLLEIATICNKAKVEFLPEGMEVIGDPTEAGLFVLGQKAGFTKKSLESKYKIVDDFAFNSNLKMRGTVIEIISSEPHSDLIEEKGPIIKSVSLSQTQESAKSLVGEQFEVPRNLVFSESKNQLFVVGAAEQVLEKCNFELGNAFGGYGSKDVSLNKILADSGLPRPTRKDAILIDLNSDSKLKWSEKIENMSLGGVRVLALAYKPFEKSEVQVEDFGDLVFVGLVSLLDPIRPEVPEAIKHCHDAGIRVVMMTGDHKVTALSIAKSAGIVAQDCEIAYSEQDLLGKSEAELEKIYSVCNVFARCTPQRKLEILRVLQAQGKVVAMTGDGVNDGPALKQANVGIAMGKVGTDVARESSEIILADDNFATIVKAIRQGRVMFSNIQKACILCLCTTLAGMTTLIGSTILVQALPFTSTQLLWLNLVTETIIGIGIAFEKGEGHEMRIKNYQTSILNYKLLPFLILNVVVMVIITLASYYWLLRFDPAIAPTGAFLVIYLAQFWNLLNFRSLHASTFKKGFFSNRVINIGLVVSVFVQILAIYSPLSGFLKFQALPFGVLISLLFISSLVFVAGELYKFVKFRKVAVR